MNSNKRNGFTLIELMIAVAIVAILTGIAWPTYVSYITRSSRSAAQSELLEMANLQEKIYQHANSYSVSVTAAYNGRSDGGLGKTPGTTADGKYALTITPNAIPTQTYVITATPLAGTTQEEPKVGSGILTISSNGTREYTRVDANDVSFTVPW
jgi:type IV pilus assembly protein PilE